MSSLLTILLTLFLIQAHAIADGINTTAPNIIQQPPLHNCQLKVGFGGVYHCGNTSYFMGDISSIQSYSTLKKSPFSNTLDVDSDQEYMVVVQTDAIKVYKEMTDLVHGEVNHETPIMIRIKKRSQYICIVMLSQLPSRDLELHNPSANRFLLRTFILDQLVNVHQIDLPNPNLDLALETDSFIGLTLLEDRTYGREYILVALKPNWIYIAKTFYQDAEIEHSASVKLDTDYKIIDFLSHSDYLFILFSHPTTNQLKVSIYRIQDLDNEIKLHNQCDITIPNRPTSDFKPSLKVKNIRSLYMFAVNLPGDEILVYHFQETWYNKLTNQCPEQGPSIKYADYQIQEHYGYAFDFVIIPAKVSVIQGFLLTSTSNQVNSSAFVTYCFPNHYLLSTEGCVSCGGRSSPGGPTAQCKECEIDNLHTSVQPYDPYQGTCPVQCKQTGRFGPQCSGCSDYMNSLDLSLPAGAYWSVDTSLQCNLFCKEGFADLTTGTCLTQEQNEVKLNNCEQLKDCYNCSLSLHCMWKNATCQSFTPVPGKPSKSQFITDFIEPGLACQKKAICGSATPFSDMSGTIELGADYIGKNQVCAWEIAVPEGRFRDILVSINATGLNPHRADNPNILFVTCCMLIKSKRSCQMEAFALNNNARNITCAGGNFASLIYWNRKSAEGAHDHFKMSYNISTSSGVGDYLTETIQKFIERVFRWFVSFLVFLSIFSALTRMQARRIRRRFLVELQEMGNFDELNQTEQDHEPINIQEVLDNDRLVSRVTYHEDILNEYQQSECPICLEEFKIKESLVRLNCKHLFHIKCFEDWAAAANNNHIKCPVCNNILI